MSKMTNTDTQNSELSDWHKELLARGHIVKTDQSCPRQDCSSCVLDMGVEVSNVYDDGGWKVGVTEKSVFECTDGHNISEKEFKNLSE